MLSGCGEVFEGRVDAGGALGEGVLLSAIVERERGGLDCMKGSKGGGISVKGLRR